MSYVHLKKKNDCKSTPSLQILYRNIHHNCYFLHLFHLQLQAILRNKVEHETVLLMSSLLIFIRSPSASCSEENRQCNWPSKQCTCHLRCNAKQIWEYCQQHWDSSRKSFGCSRTDCWCWFRQRNGQFEPYTDPAASRHGHGDASQPNSAKRAAVA